MATGKSCSRWFAPLAALLMVVSLSGCFDKEGDQRKAFIDFLQNTVMRSGERLPTLTADQKKQFGPFVSDYAILYGYSQQVNQAMDSGLRVLRIGDDVYANGEKIDSPHRPALDALASNIALTAENFGDALEDPSFLAMLAALVNSGYWFFEV